MSEFVHGTDGEPDYIVVAKRGPYVLALKGVIVSRTPCDLLVGVRVRAISTDDAVSPQAMAAAWPIFKWEKLAPTHARTHLGTKCEFPALPDGDSADYAWLANNSRIDLFATQMTQALYANFVRVYNKLATLPGVTMSCVIGELLDHIRRGHDSGLMEMREHVAIATGRMDFGGYIAHQHGIPVGGH